MRQRFAEIACPATPEALTATPEDDFLELTSRPLSEPGDIYVERYSHGGMSSGHVSSEFWRETALPLLVSRLSASKLGQG